MGKEGNPLIEQHLKESSSNPLLEKHMAESSQTSEAKKKWGKLIRRTEYSFFGICFARKDEYSDND